MSAITDFIKSYFQSVLTDAFNLIFYEFRFVLFQLQNIQGLVKVIGIINYYNFDSISPYNLYSIRGVTKKYNAMEF